MEIGAGNERIFGGDLMIMATRKGCVFYLRVVQGVADDYNDRSEQGVFARGYVDVVCVLTRSKWVACGCRRGPPDSYHMQLS
jgi:hypothetical protein